ncbi:MAG: hypothetical protein OXE83_02010 [Gammaproteobacteria bacterium]|nr:hypothetical protein [Gammaproteobacteria bacterium]
MLKRSHAKVLFVGLVGHGEAGLVECIFAPGGPCPGMDGAHEQAKGLRVAEEARHATVSCLRHEFASVVDVGISL